MHIQIPFQWTPRDYQKPIMRYFDNGGKRAAWIVHRRAGKDNTMLNQTAKMAFRRKGVYWHLFPTGKQARKTIWDGISKDGQRFIDQAFPPSIRMGINNTEMRIELRNGSIFQMVGSDNFNSLMGANPIHVTFSEWSLIKPSSWDYIRPILKENEGTAAFIYTPRGKNHGWELYQTALANPKWFCSLQSIDDTKVLTAQDMDEERRDGMPEERIQQEYYCSFLSGSPGSYYIDLLQKLEDKSLIHDFPHDTKEVYTAWDLGFTDSTAIWFFRFRSPDTKEVDIIDCYEAHGLPVSHYVDVIRSKPYQYQTHFLPHDGNDDRFRFATGISIREQLQAAGLNCRVVPRLSIQDGVQAARSLLSRTTRFHKQNCHHGLRALEQYQREYDDDTRTFAEKPLHDWSSHYADAFRYLAVTVVPLQKLTEPPTPAKVVPIKTIQDVTLDDLWQNRGRYRRG